MEREHREIGGTVRGGKSTEGVEGQVLRASALELVCVGVSGNGAGGHPVWNPTGLE